MKIFVTTFDLAPDNVRALAARGADGIELRAEHAPDLDLAGIRAATPKPLLLTYRGMRVTRPQIAAAIEAGIDLVDVEWHDTVDVALFRERVVLSHHDFDGVPHNLEELADAMLARGCAETKLAVTPHDFAGNERLLAALRARPGLTLFGMGERGLYSRILAPFLGSRLNFVAPDERHVAAAGQITLERALAIYGRSVAGASVRVFAIAGDPAGQSLSPTIHNPLFREHGVAAAYTIASIARFDEITEAFLRREPLVVSGCPSEPRGALRQEERRREGPRPAGVRLLPQPLDQQPEEAGRLAPVVGLPHRGFEIGQPIRVEIGTPTSHA